MKQLYLFEPSQKNNEQEAPVFTSWQLYVDGAARNNPGPAGAGIYLCMQGAPVERYGFYVGSKTNNQAEYYALLLGILIAKKRIERQDVLLINSDSQLLVRQLQGIYRVRSPELVPLYQGAHCLLQGLQYQVAHIPREQNEYADALANKGIDEKIAIPHVYRAALAQQGIIL
jgi:ribonuclease HI